MRPNPTVRALFALLAALPVYALGSDYPFSEKRAFELLRLPPNGPRISKWGEPTLGTKARITYTLADRPVTLDMEFGECENISPLSSLPQPGLGTPEEIAAEIEEGFKMWEKVAGIEFVRVANPQSADIVVGVAAHSDNYIFAHTSLKRNLTSTPRIDSFRRASICLGTGNWSLEPGHQILEGEKTLSLRATIGHEVGHALGLDHPANRNEFMHYKIREGIFSPTEGDIRGARELYGLPTAP